MKRLLELKNKKVIKDFLFLFYKILVNGYVIYQSIVYQILSDVKESVAALSRVPLLVTLWTVAHWAPLSMGFSRQEYWSELSFPPPGDLPNPEIEPGSLTLQADSLLSKPESDMLECITVTVVSLISGDMHAA